MSKIEQSGLPDSYQNPLVSCNLLAYVSELSNRFGFSMSEALKGVPYSEAHIQKRSNFIEWEAFCTLIENVARIIGPENVKDSMKDSFNRPAFKVYSVAGRWAVSLERLYSWLFHSIVPRLYPIHVEKMDQQPGKMTLSLQVYEGLRPSPLLMDMIEVQTIWITENLGYEPCKVERRDIPGGMVLKIEFPRQIRPLKTIWRWLTKPYDFYNYVSQLRRAQEELLEKNSELEIEAKRLREAERTISGLEVQYRRLERTLVDMIWVANLDRKFVYLSQSVESMFGYTVNEGLQKNVFDLFAQSYHNEISNRFERAIRTGGEKRKDYAFVFEVPGIKKSGEEFWIEVHASLVFGDSGDLQGIAGVTRDIGERKRAEFEKRSLEQELAHSRHMESIGQLAGGIAHDFNNMLTTVLGFSNLAKDSLGEGHEVMPYLVEISRAGERASKLVKQLLTFSKQEPTSPVPIQITELMDQWRPMLRRLVSENIEMDFDLEPIPTVLADATEIERIMINLCINATDAMSNGGKLTISTREYLLGEDDSRAIKAGTDAFACITVTDTGHGIAPELQQRVLEPFFTTKPMGQGTGLGLAVTYSIVQQHHGFMDIVSQPSRGTTIKLFFPATELKSDPEAPEVNPEKLPGGTILVVEDQDQVRMLLTQILSANGFTVMEAANGLEAVETFERQHQNIDLVLMDIVMPKMGGRDAMMMMNRIDPNVSVLFMTGYSGEDPRTGFASTQEFSLLRKPFKPNDVMAKIQELLTTRKVGT